MDGPISDVPQVTHLIQWGFYSMIILIGLLTVNTLTDMKKVIADLSEKVAIIIFKIDSHEKRLDKHDQKFSEFEKHK